MGEGEKDSEIVEGATTMLLPDESDKSGSGISPPERVVVVNAVCDASILLWARALGAQNIAENTIATIIVNPNFFLMGNSLAHSLFVFNSFFEIFRKRFLHDSVTLLQWLRD